MSPALTTLTTAGIFVALAFVSGCQTLVPENAPVPTLPADLANLFRPCTPSDGAFTVQAFDDGNLLGSVEGEWLAPSANEWQIDLASPIGSTLLRLNLRRGVLRESGPLASKVPAVEVDGASANGDARQSLAAMVTVGGYDSGIRSSEVPCLLRQRFPASWLTHLSKSEHEAGLRRLTFGGDGRDIAVTILGTAPSASPACATISWPYLVFWQQTLSWCLADRMHPANSLSGLKDYSLRWVKLDER